MFESIPDKIVCYRGVRNCIYSAQKRLQLIMQGHNFIGILCAIEAVPCEMNIAIQLAILLSSSLV